MSDSPELLKPDAEVTDNELQNIVGNLQTDETFTTLGIEDIEFLKQENEDLKCLLVKKIPSATDLNVKIAKLQERNRKLTLKIEEERRSSIERISELEHRTENLVRRNQEKQTRLDQLEIQIEKFSGESPRLEIEEEIERLRSQLETERASRGEIETQLSDLKQKSAVASKNLPEVADLYNQLKAKRKKATASLADIEAILEILEVL